MGGTINLPLRAQRLTVDDHGHAVWRTESTVREWPVAETALLACDVWDRHWSRGAMERVGAMVSRMNQVIQVARLRGVQIVHAPSDTMAFYQDAPARKRALAVRLVDAPAPIDHEDPPLPIDDSDGGSDTGEKPWYRAWTRQHPGIEIDQGRDLIADDGHVIYSFFRERGIDRLLMLGVHTNMCVLDRTFGIKQMVRWGVEVALVRDLTDAMYNPAMRPYVSHAEGTTMVVEYIEKFWCPTLASLDLLTALSEAAEG